MRASNDEGSFKLMLTVTSWRRLGCEGVPQQARQVLQEGSAHAGVGVTASRCQSSCGLTVALRSGGCLSCVS